MRSALPILAALGAVAAGCAFVIARRAARRWQRQAAAVEAEESFASFRTALAVLGVSDRVARVVYDFFASKETPLDPGGRRARPMEGLLEDHFISYPEECADALGLLLVGLGLDADWAAAPEDVRTVADAAVWLQRRLDERSRPA